MANLTPSATGFKESSDRVFALDALRAIMMLLGIVLHASITYGAIDYETAWPLIKDGSSTNPLFDLAVFFIHTFRMPVFFVAAGYFAALLFYKKGPGAMLTNRVKRILLPFAAGVLIIWPLVFAAFVFSNAAFSNSPTALSAAADTIVAGGFLPFQPGHLWFLYFLMMYALLGWLFGRLFRKEKRFTTLLNNLFTKIFQNFWLSFITMAVAFFLCLSWMGSPFILTNIQWSVDPRVFVTYFVFFGTGWMLYKTDSLHSLTKYPLLKLGVATLLFLSDGFAQWPTEPWVLVAKQGLTAVYSSLFIFGFISLFMRYFNSYSPRLSYIMDSAYWVYIVHLPIVAFIPGLMANLDIPVFLKFAITLSATAIICLVTYKYFVRGSLIGMFLNGKVYKKGKLAPATT